MTIKDREKIVPILLILLLTSITGCIQSDDQQPTLSEELNIFTWEDYFGPTTLADFENETGVTINVYTFEDEDYMLSSLESNPKKYDLIITSDSTVTELIEMKRLAKLNKTHIPNIQNLNPEFTDDPYDSGNTYSVPYFWGTTGIAINTSVVTENITSWSILWDQNYTGNITMLNNKEEVIAVALKYLGYSINTRNSTELQQAETILLTQKPLVQGYEDPLTIQEKLISGKVAIAHCYVGEAYLASDENENITYVIPDEGAPLWIDTFIIPVDSPHQYTAETFINYILDAEISANITNYQWCASPNMAAERYVDIEILEDPGIYPPEEIIEKCEYFESLDVQTYSEHNRIWSLLQN